MRTMNHDQRHALALMEDRGIRAIWTGRPRGWVWPADIRIDQGAAVAALYAMARDDERGGVVTIPTRAGHDASTTKEG